MFTNFPTPTWRKSFHQGGHFTALPHMVQKCWFSVELVTQFYKITTLLILLKVHGLLHQRSLENSLQKSKSKLAFFTIWCWYFLAATTAHQILSMKFTTMISQLWTLNTWNGSVTLKLRENCRKVGFPTLPVLSDLKCTFLVGSQIPSVGNLMFQSREFMYLSSNFKFYIGKTWMICGR